MAVELSPYAAALDAWEAATEAVLAAAVALPTDDRELAARFAHKVLATRLDTMLAVEVTALRLTEEAA